MSKYLLLFIFTLNSFCVLGQKREFYLNDDLNYISKNEFEKVEEEELTYTLRFDLDTCFMNVKVARLKTGKIDPNLYNTIQKNVLSGNPISNDYEILLINFYSGNDACSTKSYKENFAKKYNKFHKDIEATTSIKQVFTYSSNDKIEDFGKKINWQLDTNSLIEKNFFPIHYPCSGYVVIDNLGNYFCERGEYCYSQSFVNSLKEALQNKSLLTILKF
ncbi:hypothetical protein GOQ30_09425 [Flavobacterium sp. TP390]|uniref:Uncharacterized protein n=1 Tax=Flavobacterium profundi TaxID=1774945 RepID=A0A6I4ISN3_9FLAO|nr:hypothetical protein [Flavobacterium profundi]MVO09377.1 hypothetical protein [Flavobacterium profundi]